MITTHKFVENLRLRIDWYFLDRTSLHEEAWSNWQQYSDILRQLDRIPAQIVEAHKLNQRPILKMLKILVSSVYEGSTPGNAMTLLKGVGGREMEAIVFPQLWTLDTYRSAAARAQSLKSAADFIKEIEQALQQISLASKRQDCSDVVRDCVQDLVRKIPHSGGVIDQKYALGTGTSNAGYLNQKYDLNMRDEMGFPHIFNFLIMQAALEKIQFSSADVLQLIAIGGGAKDEEASDAANKLVDDEVFTAISQYFVQWPDSAAADEKYLALKKALDMLLQSNVSNREKSCARFLSAWHDANNGEDLAGFSGATETDARFSALQDALRVEDFPSQANEILKKTPINFTGIIDRHFIDELDRIEKIKDNKAAEAEFDAYRAMAKRIREIRKIKAPGKRVIAIKKLNLPHRVKDTMARVYAFDFRLNQIDDEYFDDHRLDFDENERKRQDLKLIYEHDEKLAQSLFEELSALFDVDPENRSDDEALVRNIKIVEQFYIADQNYTSLPYLDTYSQVCVDTLREISMLWSDASDNTRNLIKEIEESPQRFDILQSKVQHANLGAIGVEKLETTPPHGIEKIDLHFKSELERIEKIEDPVKAEDEIENYELTFNKILRAWWIHDKDERLAEVETFDVPDDIMELMIRIFPYESRLDRLRRSNIVDRARLIKDKNKIWVQSLEIAFGAIEDDCVAARKKMDLDRFDELLRYLERFHGLGNSFRRRDEPLLQPLIDELMPEWAALAQYQPVWEILITGVDLLEVDTANTIEKKSIHLRALFHRVKKALSFWEGQRVIVTHVAKFMPEIAKQIDKSILNADYSALVKARECIGSTRFNHTPDTIAILCPKNSELLDGVFHYPAARAILAEELNLIGERVNQAIKFLSILAKLEGQISGIITEEKSILEAGLRQVGLVNQRTFSQWALHHSNYERVTGWLCSLTSKDIAQNASLDGLTKAAFGASTKHSGTLNTWLKQNWTPYVSTEILLSVNQSQLDASAFRVRMRKHYADALMVCLQCYEPEQNKRFINAARVAAIDLLIQEITEQANPAEYSQEWMSNNLRHWSMISPNTELTILRKNLKTLLKKLQTSWNPRDLSAFNLAFSNLLECVGNYNEISLHSQLFTDADRYITSYLVEKIPSLLAMVSDIPPIGDQAPAIFYRDYQMDFSLENEFGVTELSSLISHNLEFAFANKSGEPIKLGNAVILTPDGANKIKGHILLRFKKGVLACDLDNIRLLGPDENWRISGRVSANDSHGDYDEIYISGPKDHIIQAGHTRKLEFEEMRGSDSGDRVTRVLMFYGGMTRSGPKSKDDSPPETDTVSGHRERRLSIVNTMPSDGIEDLDLPLYVDFISPTRVLNDGKGSTDLKVNLTSVVAPGKRSQILFRTIHRDKGKAGLPAHTVWSRSKIVMRIDINDAETGEQKNWALCSKGQAAAIKPALLSEDGKTSWDGVFVSQGRNAEWVFTHPAVKGQVLPTLPRGKSLQLSINNIITSERPGPAKIYIRCENFPGFPDREFVLPVTKSKITETLTEYSFTSETRTDVKIASDLDVVGNTEIAGSVKANGVEHATLPVGVIMPYASNQKGVPDGWLPCDGRWIDKKHTELRRITGLDRTPNLVGRVIIGAIANSTLPSGFDSMDYDKENGVHFDGRNSMNPHQSGGKWKFKLKESQLPSHAHTICHGDFGTGHYYDLLSNTDGDTHRMTPLQKNMDWIPEKARNYIRSTDSTGSNGFVSNTQPYYTLYYIIKY